MVYIIFVIKFYILSKIVLVKYMLFSFRPLNFGYKRGIGSYSTFSINIDSFYIDGWTTNRLKVC